MNKISARYLNLPKAYLLTLLAVAWIPSFPDSCWGLSGDEVVVVVTSRMAEATDIARYYMEKRNIPAKHLIKTSLTLDETISREDYEDDLAEVVSDKIAALRPARISTVVCIYGVPLKVAPPPLSWADEDTLKQLEKEEGLLQVSEPLPAEDARRLATIREEKKKLLGSDQGAAVDSELAMVMAGDYLRDGWIENPYFIGYQGRKLTYGKDQVLLVARLDGPDPAQVYRLIDDSLVVEQTGLTGSACFDARWPRREEQGASGYDFYDLSLHKAAAILAAKMTVHLDQAEALIAPGACPQTALYAGWYSLGNYVDSIQWQKGAIGYHMASLECSSLRDSRRPLWCVQILAHGAAATVGPVDEPYIQAFPPPELFFAALKEGGLSLGESFLLSSPFLSWQMILVGDPLYRPFASAAKGTAGGVKAK